MINLDAQSLIGIPLKRVALTDTYVLTYSSTDNTLSLQAQGSAGGFVTSITGTANQVIASAATGAVTLSTPQSIAAASTPTFAGLTLTGNLTLGDANNIVINATTGTKIGTATTQKIGFWNTTPAIQPPAYTITNDTTDRTYDANATTVEELADIVATLYRDLRVVGIFA